MEKQGRPRGDAVPPALAKEEKCREKKKKQQQQQHPRTGKLFRKKPLKSVGSFVNRIIRTLGTFTQSGDVSVARNAAEEDEDDGGFRNGASPCTLSAGSAVLVRDADAVAAAQEAAITWERAVRNGSGAYHPLRTGRDKLLCQYGDKVPGVLGLKNHGNTCFMNAVVQCMSNTDLLAEYLGLERYKLDLSSQSGEDARRDEVRLAKGGEVTEQLARLVKALWTLEYTPQLSVDFKTIVSKYGSQFRGNSQHDALEFLLWLLDRVHEDVHLASNNNNNKFQLPQQDPSGGEVAPDRSHFLQPGLQHSFVKEHFQAQYKCSLTCPHCLKQSNTFDPFLCISLPIPLRQTRSLCVILVFSTKGQRFLRVGLAVPLFGSVACLRRTVANEGKLSPDQVILTEVYSIGFRRSFFDEDDVSSVAEDDVIYAFQAPPLYIRGGSARISGYHHSLPSSPYYSGHEAQRLPSCGTLSSEFLNQGNPAKILLLVCNAAGAGQQVVRFGPPFLMREDRCISWDQLQQSILSKLYYLMINGAQAQNIRVLFNVRVVGGSAMYSYLSPQDEQPLYHPAVDRALKLCGSGGPPHVKLIIEWEHRVKDCLFGNIQEEVVKEAESVRNQQQQQVQHYSCTLDECFQLYTKEEQLAPDDAWKCPHCKQLQQGMVKMSLWTLPDILILHLKRFRQVGERRNKLTTLVHFPLTGLDMAPHMVNHSHSKEPSWDQSRQQHQLAPLHFMYDLYAVCNHHGGMHGGHYTAFCRNSVDGQWYSYDDSSAEAIPEAEVCTRGAYILFYQRRNTIPPWSASSSITGSTSSSTSDHWLVRLAGGSKRGSLMSGGPSPCPAVPTQPGSPELPVFGDEAPQVVETNGFESEPFVRGTQGRSLSMRSPTRPKEALNKVLPLRWSFGSKDPIRRPQPVQSEELVEYLESGRRPRCTKEPIVALVATPPRGRGGRGGVPDLTEALDCSSPSGSSGQLASDSSCSPKVPAGQWRNLGPAEFGSLRLRSSKRARHDPSRTLGRDSGRTPDLHFHFRRGAFLDGHISHSAPQSRDSTLGRSRGPHQAPVGTITRAALKDLGGGGGSVGQRGREARSHDSLLSFLKPVLLRKDAALASLAPLMANGHGCKASPANRTPPACNGWRREGVSEGHDPAETKRILSSSNIQLSEVFGKPVSLHRNGEVAAAQRPLLAETPGYHVMAVQRT